MTMIDKNRVTRIRINQPKKSSVTLYKRTSGDTFDDGTLYQYAYIPPKTVDSGLMGDGVPNNPNNIWLYQEGEAVSPSIDDKIIDSDGNEYIVLTVGVQMNFVPGWAVWKLLVVGV